MNFIYRHLKNRILELSQSCSAIISTGPRQSSKTAMLHFLAQKENKGREYLSLDDHSARDMAKNDPALFLQIHKPPAVRYASKPFNNGDWMHFYREALYELGHKYYDALCETV